MGRSWVGHVVACGARPGVRRAAGRRVAVRREAGRREAVRCVAGWRVAIPYCSRPSALVLAALSAALAFVLESMLFGECERGWVGASLHHCTDGEESVSGWVGAWVGGCVHWHVRRNVGGASACACVCAYAVAACAVAACAAATCRFPISCAAVTASCQSSK